MAADTDAATRSPDRSKATDGDDEEEDHREAKKMKRINPGTDEAAAAAQDEDEDELEVDSPLCQPYIPGPEDWSDRFANPEIHAAYQTADAKYREKLHRMGKLPTYHYFDRFSCLSTERQLLPIRDTARNAVLSAAKFILPLSSSIGGKPLVRSAGFWIDWDEESKSGIILTTAHLIRSKEAKISRYTGSFGTDEHDPHAKVIVHLLDVTTVEGRLLYHQEHYDIAFFKAGVDQCVPLPSFTHRVKKCPRGLPAWKR